MNIAGYLIFAVAVAFVSLYLKQIRADFALCITLATVILMLGIAMPRIIILVDDIRRMANGNSIPTEYITPVFKIIGISYLTQISSDICRDTGETALSNQVETLGKIAIVFITLPIVEDVFGMILDLLE